jgi:hypothetical protein
VGEKNKPAMSAIKLCSQNIQHRKVSLLVFIFLSHIFLSAEASRGQTAGQKNVRQKNTTPDKASKLP